MALAKTYNPGELKHLNVLMASTNREVCPQCLDKNCNGIDCEDDEPDLASAKNKFFSDGSFEYVLSAKQDRPNNVFGHSAFGKDSYLCTQRAQVTEGASMDSDPTALQEDVCIMFAESEQESNGLDRDHQEADQESDSSSGSEVDTHNESS